MTKDLNADLKSSSCERWEMPSFQGQSPTRQMTREELETIRRNAKQEGYASGYQEGMQKAESEIESYRANLSNLFSKLANPLDSVTHEVEQILLDLVVKMIQLLTRDKVTHDPEILLQLIREGLYLFKEEERMQISLQVDPACARMLRSWVDPELLKKISLIEENKFKPGDCFLESKSSRIDLSFETRLKKIMQQLINGNTDESTQLESHE